MISSLNYHAIAALPPDWQELLPRIPAAIGITAVFAFMAWALRGVTIRGACAGAVITFFVFAVAGFSGFLAILTVFVLTAAATQAGYARKLQLGTAEPRIGRNARQVFANLLLTALVATPAIFFPAARAMLLIGACAALAEAAADTVSSELGQSFGGKVYLITDLRVVSAGQNGGISVAGTVCGILAAAVVTLACWWLRLLPVNGIAIVFIAATLGMFFDSLLGATLEQPGLLGNNSVNYLSNGFSAAIALIATMVFA